MAFIVKNTTIISPLDLIAPHSCRGCGSLGMPLCNRCKNNILLHHQTMCPNCKTYNSTTKCPKCDFMPPTFVIDRRSSAIGQLISDYKYSSLRALSYPIAEICDEILPDILGPVSIVPLPTISQHIRERGFDHTLKIAKSICKLRPAYKTERLLIRAKNTVQVGSSQSARISQAKKAYQINPKIRIDSSATYILLDDVWTTGASMKSAIKQLQFAGINKIILLILAVS